MSVFPLAYLRGWCPCATCQGHGSTRVFVPATANEIVGLRNVGSYAVSFEWNDGHSTGIYTWDSLREMCPCEPCGSGRAGTPANILEPSSAGK